MYHTRTTLKAGFVERKEWRYHALIKEDEREEKRKRISALFFSQPLNLLFRGHENEAVRGRIGTALFAFERATCPLKRVALRN